MRAQSPVSALLTPCFTARLRIPMQPCHGLPRFSPPYLAPDPAVVPVVYGLCYLGVPTWITAVWGMEISVFCWFMWVSSERMSASHAKVSEYSCKQGCTVNKTKFVSELVLISDQQNLWQSSSKYNHCVLWKAVHLRIRNLPVIPESVKNEVNCMFVCLIICLYKIWVFSKVKYCKISHKISICQKLRTVEINALGPHASSAELWLTDYQLPD